MLRIYTHAHTHHSGLDHISLLSRSAVEVDMNSSDVTGMTLANELISLDPRPRRPVNTEPVHRLLAVAATAHMQLQRSLSDR